ncbi:MAG: radical SAM protein [PVC group bacterium]
MKVLCLIPPAEDKNSSIQTDAVLSRCAGIVLKSHYILTPIGLAYLASALREWTRADVDILDCLAEDLDLEPALCRIKEISPDVIFFVLGTPTLEFSRRWIRMLKESLPVLRVVAVGPHVTALPEKSLRAVPLDYVIRGEPEQAASHLIKALEEGRGINGIKGISYRAGDECRSNPDQPLLEDVDVFPFPARDLLPNEKYAAPFARQVPFGLIVTARGCPFQCVYCATRGYYGKTWRARSVESVISELKEMVNRYRIRDIGFWDDTFTIDRARVIAICRRIIKEGLNIEWICLSRVDTVDPEVLGWMKKAGCYQIQFGVESGSEEVLRALGKNTTVRQIKDAFRWSKETGIDPAAFFMLGNPGETDKNVEETIELALELPAGFASFNINTPYPGCELFEQMKKKLGGDWTHFDAKHASYQTGFDEKSLEKYIREAYRRFYYRPKYIFKLLRQIRSPGDLLKYMKTALDVFRRF